MTTREELTAKLNSLNDAVVAEKSQVTAAIGELKVAIEDLTDKVKELESADFSAEIAQVDAALASVEGIYEVESEPAPEPIEVEPIE